ncbi:MAG: hypothetical protein WBC22_17010 [Sedimentisphaerales bacterium]
MYKIAKNPRRVKPELADMAHAATNSPPVARDSHRESCIEHPASRIAFLGRKWG